MMTGAFVPRSSPMHRYRKIERALTKSTQTVPMTAIATAAVLVPLTNKEAMNNESNLDFISCYSSNAGGNSYMHASHADTV